MIYKAVIQACVICAGASICGAAVNVLAPWGIEFVVKERVLEALPDSLIGAESAVPATPVVEPASVTLQQAKTLFDRGQAVFVDARPGFDYVAGHIPGAVSIPFDEIEYYGATIAGLDKKRPVVVYCSAESCDLSVRLADVLAQRGFTSIRVFFGGSVAWERAGFPLSRGE